MAMIAAFGAIIWAGHLYVCMLVVLLQSLVFKEMVNVRYNIAKEKSVPLFRTLQWSWFAVAVFYTYGDFFHEFVLEHRELLWLAPITKWHAGVSFSMYCCIFVLSVLTLKKGFYRYQVGQLTWTIVTICMIVAQLKFVAHNIFSGLFWFFFPCSLVICNDCFAYFCGMTLGRKIIKAPFLKISPNKTWEGFLGAMVFTVVIAYFAAGFLAQYQWFTCPVERLTLGLASNDGYTQLHCVADPVFQVQEMHIPGPILRFFKNFLLIDLNMMLERVFGTSCLVTKPIQLHAMVMASFTSLIAPFGGFWASAIKRTYGIKDFDSIIPGHGGVTDRMDCQFITALFVSVYFRTFIRPHAVTVGSLLAQASLLPLEQRQELMLELSKLALDES
ncbi:phosphatidate cytidylyltransferase [Tribonema minus]|uniref:phosphatidate cytidylyltransferase n=1 Tax=Tribonema minus TaxID=303371 RepID=A0A836C8B8_9STRA|nr:phosphatidate cytidylyltransferase [Tribonema minus]